MQNDLIDSPAQRKRRNSPENFTQGTVHTSSHGGSPPDDLVHKGPRASTAHGGRLSTDNLKLKPVGFIERKLHVPKGDYKNPSNGKARRIITLGVSGTNQGVSQRNSANNGMLIYN